MPDEVIVHILSCMPILDAVRTVLLRRFGYLWTLVHTLKVDMDEFHRQFSTNDEWEDDDNERFYIFVRHVLILHKRLSINKFHLCVELNSYAESVKAAHDIKTWVRFALDRQAKEIILHNFSEYCFDSGSWWPNLTSQSLVTLVLDCCKIWTRFHLNSGSLKKLLLDECSICDEELRRLISGCPSLQELVIVSSYLMHNISFSAPNIDKLSLVLSGEYQWSNPLSLECPNIKTLNLDIEDGLDIIDVSSVRDVYVKNILYGAYNDDIPTMLKLFYGKLDGAEVIHLSRCASWRFLDTIQKLNLLQHKWKRVVLELEEFCQVELLGIYHLMRSLRHLEELTIYTTEDFKAGTDLLPLEPSSAYVTPQLKTITLRGYRKSWKSHLPLVEFLLGGAAVLDKLVILPIKHRLEAAEDFEFVKRVSSFPRASTSARVLFA